MSAKEYKYLLFDMDGTLTDTYEGITKSFKYALAHFGIEEECEALKKVIGPPLIDSFCSFYGFDEETGRKAVEKYRERYSGVGWRENTLFDGVEDMLCKCKAAGRTVALATSKPWFFAEKILKEHGISKYFDVTAGAELDGSIGTKSQVIQKALSELGNPPKDSVLMIGDRRHDVEGAKLCGIDCVGVCVGYADDGELEKAGADYIVDTIEDLKEFILSH